MVLLSLVTAILTFLSVPTGAQALTAGGSTAPPVLAGNLASDASVTHVQASATAKAGATSARYYVGCYARATKPFTVTHSSRNIYAEGKLTSCFGSPDSCHLGVDLEQYNGRTHRWHVVAHNGGSWKRCKIGKPVQAVYRNCHHDNSTRWYYRSSIYLVVEKNGRYGNMGHTYSKGNLFWCS
ncbi:hypothetical protein [Streptomyces naphthomycinicus]|uniref:hypothetical protein n=1 Tax=Streptomyces naphthomycinicus TaxID=2872625 RepID=UPI001CED2812|nr:hypothetical protein [Streptomyces sp. TML10]